MSLVAPTGILAMGEEPERECVGSLGIVARRERVVRWSCRKY